MSRHLRALGVWWKVTRGPVWSSLSPSVAPTRRDRRCTDKDRPHAVPEDRRTYAHIPSIPDSPVKVTLWHLLDRTTREEGLALSFNSNRGPSMSSSKVQ
ncbi:hypothetical protein NQZ68_034790 [Dissostichus eleginoides]|nr:hypothetical protein NQZ68_034790 [Dissostichus eleginoides]